MAGDKGRDGAGDVAMLTPELHVSELFKEGDRGITRDDYASFCPTYAAMVAKPWHTWKDDEGCLSCPEYMENADFFCRKYNKHCFGKERIEPEDKKPWWDDPVFMVPKKNIYGIGG